MARQTNSLLKESWSMVVTYVSAMILVFVLTFHLLLQSPLTGRVFEETLSFNYAINNLVYYKALFGLLLFAAVIHGMNGLRVMAIEWLHPKSLGWLLNLIVVVLMAVFLAVGTFTLVVVS